MQREEKKQQTDIDPLLAATQRIMLLEEENRGLRAELRGEKNRAQVLQQSELRLRKIAEANIIGIGSWGPGG